MNLKTKARKDVANKKVSLKKTGGGPSSGDELDPVTESVLGLINVKTVTGLKSQFDSDANEAVMFFFCFSRNYNFY